MEFTELTEFHQKAALGVGKLFQTARRNEFQKLHEFLTLFGSAC